MPLRYLELDNNIYDMLLQGLLSVVNEIFLLAEHRMCARHIYANWRKKHRLQEYQKRFWNTKRGSGRLQRLQVRCCLIITRTNSPTKLLEDGKICRIQTPYIGAELGSRWDPIVNLLITT
jgi:hypothetical protein